MKQIEILFNGLILQVDVTSYTPGRPAPIAATPDGPGYDDDGEAEECEWQVVKKETDCEGSALDLFNRCLDGYPTMAEELHDLICEKIREEQE